MVGLGKFTGLDSMYSSGVVRHCSRQGGDVNEESEETLLYNSLCIHAM